VHSNEITAGISLLVDPWGMWTLDNANHNLIQGNVIDSGINAIGLFGSVTPLGPFPKSHENVVVANPGQVTENLPDDLDPTFGNVLIGVKPVDAAGMALWQDVLLNVGPRTTDRGEDFSRVFFTPLSAGLNMVDVPLKPITPHTARSLAAAIGATVVIRLNVPRQRFEGFTIRDDGPGFPIEGGNGYIVNVTEDKVFSFVGAAWTNTPPVKAAPSATARTSAWAFVVSGVVSDTPGGVVTIRNLTTGAVARSAIHPSTGHFSAAWADLNRQSVVQVGDTLEFDFTDGSGELIGRVRRHLGMDDIQNAYLHLMLRPEELLPTQTRLMQNYPNPFNPETWIPFALAADAPVTITIYDTAGGLVRRLNLGQREAGVYTARERALYWDGRNDAGERVSSGTYFYQLRAGEFTATRKLVIMK